MNNDTKIDLGRWRNECAEDIQRFSKYWSSQVSHADFPMHMERGEWDEQFLSFVEAAKKGQP